MPRSPVPDLCLRVLASDPTRDRPYTTTEVQQAVAKLGRNVTRDTIAKHLRPMADAPKGKIAPVEWYAGHVVTIEHAWKLSSEGWRRIADAAIEKEG